MTTVTKLEQTQVEKANASGKRPVVFVHGTVVAPHQLGSLGQGLRRRGVRTFPGVAGRSGHRGRGEGAPGGHGQEVDQGCGGPLRRGHPWTQEEAGRRRTLVRRADDGDPGRSRVVQGFGRDLSCTVPRRPAVAHLRPPVRIAGAAESRQSQPRRPLTFEQFQYSFANAVGEGEAKHLYDTFCVPAPGEPLFQAAAANLNPWTEDKVDTKNPKRGPMLIISGEHDHTVPWSIAKASFKREKRNAGVTEIVKIPGRGHALTIDGGWREVADTALGFIKKHG